MTAIETVAAEPFTGNFGPAQERPTIIVATDGSDGSNAAFNAARLMAEKQDEDRRVREILK